MEVTCYEINMQQESSLRLRVKKRIFQKIVLFLELIAQFTVVELVENKPGPVFFDVQLLATIYWRKFGKCWWQDCDKIVTRYREIEDKSIYEQSIFVEETLKRTLLEHVSLASVFCIIIMLAQCRETV